MNELDGWTKSKKSRTPTPEPVSADPKSAEDEAMDTSDHSAPESKSELANKDQVETSNESNTNKNSLLPDLPKPVPTNVKKAADNEGKEDGAEKCSDTENTEQNANDKTKEEKLVEDAIAVKQ